MSDGNESGRDPRVLFRFGSDRSGRIGWRSRFGRLDRSRARDCLADAALT